MTATTILGWLAGIGSSLLWISSSAVAAESGPESPPFALGIEYMVPGLAEVYARTGVVWAKAAAISCTWGDIERRPPVAGQHSYNWEAADRVVLEYQRAGFRHFHVYLRCMNPWAASKPVKPIGGGSSLPKPEYLEDYKAFLRAFVQRYDTHHPDHCPGLLYPIEYWEVEAEWGTGFWQGTVEEYLKLLKVAYPTIKEANPRAKVILIGFFLAGLFEGHPDPKEIPTTLAAMPAQRRRVTERYLAEMQQLLAHPDLFDVVEFHSLSDWSEIPGMARFLRQTMRANGYEKPIWVGDVNYTASPMMFWGIPVPPYTEAQKPAIEATLKALARPTDRRHREVLAWFRAEQARGLVKKVVLAMAEGLAGINIGNLKDEPLFGLAPTIAGTVAFQGLIDTTVNPLKPGAPRPAYYALQLLVEKLVGFSEVRPLDVGKGIYAFRFLVRNRPVYVLWYDDGRRYLPGEQEPSIKVQLPFPSGVYRLTETPTAPGPIPARTVSVPNGVWTAELGCTPIFLEPQGT
jgi:hypothetical protein